MKRSRRPIERGRVFQAGPLEVPEIGKRAISVYLPPGYDRDQERRYPVTYMFDGQNIFGDEGSFAGGWRMHLVLDRLAARGHTVPIVVGVHHGGAARIDELSPWKTAASRGGGGKADALLKWLADDLHGQVRRNLRALDGPAHTQVGGSSMGGLAALYALFHRPDVFGGALAMSPALWVGGGRIFQMIAGARLPWSCRLYLDAGGHEGGMAYAAQRLAHLLAARGLLPGRHLMWRSDKRGRHHEPSWRRRLPGALRFLLGAK